MDMSTFSLVSIVIGAIAIGIGIYVTITVRKFIKEFETEEKFNEKPKETPPAQPPIIEKKNIQKERKPLISIKLKKEEPKQEVEEELKI